MNDTLLQPDLPDSNIRINKPKNNNRVQSESSNDYIYIIIAVIAIITIAVILIIWLIKYRNKDQGMPARPINKPPPRKEMVTPVVPQNKQEIKEEQQDETPITMDDEEVLKHINKDLGDEEEDEEEE